jgi:succinate dehydrogenase/fumarate reductase flavoprotein subunit
MQENAEIIREASKLRKGIKKISELKKGLYFIKSILKSFKNSENVVSTWEVKSALVVCDPKNCLNSTRDQRSSL